MIRPLLQLYLQPSILYPLPLTYWFPFAVDENTYIYCYIYLNILIFVSATFGCSFDCFFMGLIIKMSGLFDILACRVKELTNVLSTEVKNQGLDSKQFMEQETLKQVIEMHYSIYE